MRRWRKRILVLVALAAVVVLLRLLVFRPTPVPVTAQQVIRGKVEDTVVNSRAGTVESRLRSKMSPGISGLVAEVAVKKGRPVSKGDLLLRIDDSEYQAQVALAARSLDAAKAAVDQANLAAVQAERDRVRAESLAGDRLLSDQALEEARTRAETTAAALTAAKEQAKQAAASLEAARAVLAKTVMTAPFDGVVLDVTTEVGEWISPSPPGVYIPPIFDLINLDSLYVSAPLDEADVARARVGLPVRITMDAFRGQSFAGTLTYVSSYVETRQEQNRTLTVEAVFNDQDLPPNLLPGLSADLEVILDTRDNVVRIPSFALLEGNHVLVVSGDRLVKRSVEVGLANWEYTEITSGLSEGDWVVTSLDRPEVKAGARVRVTSETAR